MNQNLHSIQIFPSLLSADFGCLAKPIDSLVESGCKRLHLDVMDGHFVPNLSIGVPVVQSIANSYPKLFKDVHLMIEKPEHYIEPFIEAGAHSISVHQEVEPDLSFLRQTCKSHGIKLGLALNPDTSIKQCEPFLDLLDYVVIMGVQPGFGGQSFNETALDKIAWLRDRWSKPIQVDGGVEPELLGTLIDHGANWFVAGSSIFRTGNEPGKTYQEMRNLIDRET